ncbi:MAG: DUF1145 domain-containing protein [Opitutaceae bacterium]|nr:DUF1145 domain-containing protein [Opitutaceae bacterium]
MTLTQKQIALFRLILIGYWVSFVVAVLFFFESRLGYYHVVFGEMIFFIHIGETFVFNNTLKKYSKNVMRDKLLMLPFGFLIPMQRKLECKA